MLAQFTSIAKVIGKSKNYLTQQEVDMIGQKVFEGFKHSEERMQQETKNMEKYDQVYGLDGQWEDDQNKQSEVFLYKADMKSEARIKLELGDIIGALYKTHKPLTKGLLELVFSQVLNSALQAKNKPKLIQLGIFLIDDMLEYLDRDFVGQERWQRLIQVVLQYSSNERLAIRQAAVYGIGALAESQPAGD